MEERFIVLSQELPHLVHLGKETLHMAPRMQVYGPYTDNCANANITLEREVKRNDKVRKERFVVVFFDVFFPSLGRLLGKLKQHVI